MVDAARCHQDTLDAEINAGFDACVPKAKTIPAPGETLGDMYVRTGHTAFNTISIENIGVAPLTWSGATFSGPDASVFSLFDQMSQAAPRFPRQIGVGGGLRIIEVRCTGGAQERWYRATLTFHTNDPTTPDQSFQVKCLVDNTPPNVTHHVPAPDGKNGWYVTQIPVTVNAIDPGGENASGVKETYCNRGGQEWWFYGGVQTVMADLGGKRRHGVLGGGSRGQCRQRELRRVQARHAPALRGARSRARPDVLRLEQHRDEAELQLR